MVDPSPHDGVFVLGEGAQHPSAPLQFLDEAALAAIASADPVFAAT